METTLVEVQKCLKGLRLHGMESSLETRVLEASQGTTLTEILASLLQDELDLRRSRKMATGFRTSGLRERTTLAEFDWDYNPGIPKKCIFELATAKFVREGEDILLIGAAGTGKSHVAKAIANASINFGYRVVFRDAAKLLEDLFEASQLKTKKKILKQFTGADLLVIDDLFLRKTMPETGPDDLLQVIVSRYNLRKSTVITSNRPLEDWGPLMGDNAAASAILDRLLHRGHLLKFDGRSYRLKEAARRRTNKEVQDLLSTKK